MNETQAAPPRGPIGLAITGLIFSIFFPPLGMILSIVARGKYKRTGATGGRGMATAGMIVGIIMTALLVLYVGAIIVTEAM